jgi:hypothetical protein
MMEYTIEEYHNPEYRSKTYLLKYGAYSMEVPQCDGTVPRLQIQMAMNKLKAAYDNREFYIPPIQITKKEILK